METRAQQLEAEVATTISRGDTGPHDQPPRHGSGQGLAGEDLTAQGKVDTVKADKDLVLFKKKVVKLKLWFVKVGKTANEADRGRVHHRGERGCGATPHPLLPGQDLLLVCAQRGNAKENLIAFLEQIDGFKSGVKVRRCLPGLAVVLTKIKDKSKALSWSWALATLYTQIKLMEVRRMRVWRARKDLPLIWEKLLWKPLK